MRGTQTFWLDLPRLASLGSDANLVVRMMRAADDIAIANWGLRQFSKEQPRLSRHVQSGAKRYFVRLQCGHLTEAVPLIGELKGSSGLMAIVRESDGDIKSAFQELSECLPGGQDRRNFDRWIESIRNRAAFHYDPSLVDRAITSRSSRPGSLTSKITRGTETDLWRSGLADDIEDTIVCRLLWRIPLAADVQVEADRIAAFGSRLCRQFIDLAGDVSFKYLRQNVVK